MNLNSKPVLAAAMLLCAAQTAHALVEPVMSEARTTVFLQTCGASCMEPPFEFSQTLWRSQGAGDSPVLSTGFYPTPNGPTQYAYANADLATSKLHVVTSGQADQDNRRLYGAVAASLGDTLTVVGSGQSRLSVATSGTLSMWADPTNYYMSITLQLLQPGSLAAFSRGDYDSVQQITSVSQALGGADWGSPSSLALPGTLELVFDTPATSFEWSATFYATYLLTGSQSINMDLGHTLTVNFDAPEGAQVLSASGYVPAATGWVPMPAVPEPGTVAMMLAGLVLVGVHAVKRRKA